ncbi:hypothetical protein [Blastomonas sp. AAP25]|uniref:hypothetical protein n=1 Tax=Blastomonas sp. AAP25 TaxID=1523416 RepID=UPI000A4C1D76|nr:hypothetical protein [Blastomonas sp. AAP25]
MTTPTPYAHNPRWAAVHLAGDRRRNDPSAIVHGRDGVTHPFWAPEWKLKKDAR